MSCIRFEHVQRSRLQSETTSWLQFWCKQGKRRVRGARPGYPWSTPEVRLPGFSLLKVLVDFYRHECLQDAGFLWPQVVVSHENFWEISESSPFQASKPMSRNRLLEIMRGTLHQLGNSLDVATRAGYNRLRRFLPTLGNVLQLEPTDMQALGSWVEIPSNGGPEPITKSRAVWTMGRHYAGGNAARSAATKVAILGRFWELFHQKAGKLALTDKKLLPRGSWSWEEVFVANGKMPALEIKPLEARPDVVEVEDPAELAATELPTSASGMEPEPEAEEETEEIVADDSSTTSSSASDVSARGSDVEGVVPFDEALDTAWLKQGTKLHIVKLHDDAARPVPWCRDFAFQQDAKEKGNGFGHTTRQHFCQRCLARMPRGVYSAIASQCGWLH